MYSSYQVPIFHSAAEFCIFFDDRICINFRQQFDILRIVAKADKAVVVRRIFAGLPLLPHEFDALVSMAWVGFKEMGDLVPLVASGILNNEWDGLRRRIVSSTTNDQVAKAGTENRRKEEWELFSTGVYRVSQNRVRGPDVKAQVEALQKNWHCGIPGGHIHYRW
jgi:hypothetical protein